MSKFMRKMAAVVPFAHLLGVHAESETDKDDEKKEEAKRADWAKKAESDDDRKQKDDESDDDYAKRMEKMDDDEEDDKKAKKAKGEKDDDESEGMEDDSEEAKAVRQSERARCARIIAHGIKNGCVSQAGVFAFDTSMTSTQAISALSASKLDSNANRSGLGQRMAAVKVPNVGADSPSHIDPNNPQAAAKAIADRVIAAAAKARGETA